MFDEDGNIVTEDGKFVITQAYCHNGHDLIDSEHKISSYPSIKLLVSDGKAEEYIYISAVQGDNVKEYNKGFKKHTLLTISCPVCREELDNIAPCDCVQGSKFVAIYFNKKRSFSGCVGICNSWDCYRSFMNTAWRIISRLADKSAE